MQLLASGFWPLHTFYYHTTLCSSNVFVVCTFEHPCGATQSSLQKGPSPRYSFYYSIFFDHPLSCDTSLTQPVFMTFAILKVQTAKLQVIVRFVTGQGVGVGFGLVLGRRGSF